ncbi:MAG: acid--CoA ligase, partial [Rhodospirillaceae bacterium]|nr:acid--CoA ligase [Rhodospirillaceae bacterium]
ADIIIRGGANIYPAEVEAAIDAHPAVRSSVVFGLPDDDLGEKVVAIVDAVLPVSEEELVRHLRTQISPYKTPAVFEFTDAPLRNDCGKVRRSDLRAARLGPQAPLPAVAVA